MNPKIFAVRIRDLRKARELTQQDLAEKLGVSRQTVFLVESGQSLPSLPLAIKFASLFNQSLENLFNLHKEETMDKNLSLRGLHSEIDRFFEDAFSPRSMMLGSTISAPALNIHQDEKNIYIEAAVAGFNADEIETELSDDYLTIRGEKSEEHEEKDLPAQAGKTFMRREFAYGSFERTIGLPEGIDTDKADSALKDGTLMITLPKSPEVKPRVKTLKPKIS